MNYRFLVLAAFLFYACGDKKPASAEAQQPLHNDTISHSSAYFPVMDFLKSEIAAVDELPVGIMKYRSTATSNDSAYIQREEFKQLAAEFTPAELNDPEFKKEFKETSFIDKSTDGATFFYNTTNNDIALKRVDVVTRKTDTYDKVNSIYLEKKFAKGDSSVTKKLFWKPGRNFQVITEITKKTGATATELIKVVWDNRE